jgi:hypothetical protein
MEFYAPMFVFTGILMLAAMGVTLLPDFTWWARRRRMDLQRVRNDD